MFISRKTYEAEKAQYQKMIRLLDAEKSELRTMIGEKAVRIHHLEQELREARDLKAIVEKLYPLHAMMGTCCISDGSSGYQLNLPDTVPVYVPDVLGGKVIKQEATKCIIININGHVEEGLTKEKPDKGYKYKLIRKSK